MQVKINTRLLLLALILIFSFNSTSLSFASFKIEKSQATRLEIYTYVSLLKDPYFNIAGNFSQFSGIPEGEIRIRRFNDANELLTRLELEKSNPVADVVIGIDNTLIHLIEDISSILESYTPAPISQIDPNLIQNLDPQYFLIPYDYGIISFYYQNQIINTSTHPELQNLTLDSLLTSDLLPMLIVENPLHSSPGLGFLLWTIAVYGDPEINFHGLLGENWRDWWRTSRNQITLTDSWSDAFVIFFEDESKPIMVSYGTSPAYSYCQWGDDSTSAVVTHEGNQQNAWLQIEGIGLVKDAPNRENAKQFIDWFLSPSLQSEIPEHQWMYPANTEVNLSPCFEESVIHPDDVYRLNDLLSPDLLADNLAYWKDQWERVIVGAPSFELYSTILGLMILAIPVLFRKRKKRL